MRLKNVLAGLFLLLMSSDGLFITPISTHFECQSPSGSCKVEQQFFFESKQLEFNIRDLTHKEIFSTKRKFFKRGYHLSLGTPAFNFAAGNYLSNEDANAMLTLVRDFQANPTQNYIYIHEEGNFYFIFETLLLLFVGIALCWVGIKPAKNSQSA